MHLQQKCAFAPRRSGLACVPIFTHEFVKRLCDLVSNSWIMSTDLRENPILVHSWSWSRVGTASALQGYQVSTLTWPGTKSLSKGLRNLQPCLPRPEKSCRRRSYGNSDRIARQTLQLRNKLGRVLTWSGFCMCRLVEVLMLRVGGTYSSVKSHWSSAVSGRWKRGSHHDAGSTINLAAARMCSDSAARAPEIGRTHSTRIESRASYIVAFRQDTLLIVEVLISVYHQRHVHKTLLLVLRLSSCIVLSLPWEIWTARGHHHSGGPLAVTFNHCSFCNYESLRRARTLVFCFKVSQDATIEWLPLRPLGRCVSLTGNCWSPGASQSHLSLSIQQKSLEAVTVIECVATHGLRPMPSDRPHAWWSGTPSLARLRSAAVDYDLGLSRFTTNLVNKSKQDAPPTDTRLCLSLPTARNHRGFTASVIKPGCQSYPRCTAISTRLKKAYLTWTEVGWEYSGLELILHVYTLDVNAVDLEICFFPEISTCYEPFRFHKLHS